DSRDLLHSAQQEAGFDAVWPVPHDRLPASVDPHAALARIARQHEEDRRVRRLQHLLLVLQPALPGDAGRNRSRERRRHLDSESMRAVDACELVVLDRWRRAGPRADRMAVKAGHYSHWV